MSEKNTITITAPNPAFNGISAGVQFAGGQAEILAGNRAALEYFQRAGFGISENVPAPKGEDSALKIEKTAAVVKVASTPPADSTEAKEQAKTEAKTTDKAKTAAKEAVKETPKTATEQQAGITSTGTTNVAGDGPAGALHNVGRDGADPGAKDPVTGTPDAPTGI